MKYPQAYDTILLQALPMLENLPKAKGVQGTAYFLNENFVIKSYSGEEASRLRPVLDSFCNEINLLKKQGIHLPQIYSWVERPMMIGGHMFEYGSHIYILQQRMPGESLFLPNKDVLFEMCNSFANASECEIAYGGSGEKKHAQILVNIAEIMFDNFIEANKQIADLPKAMLENLYEQLQYHFLSGKFSVPDVNNGNILFSNNGDFSIIDPIVLDMCLKREDRPLQFPSYLFYGCVLIFKNNAKLFEISDKIDNYYSKGYITTAQRLMVNGKLKQNKTALYNALEHMLSSAQHCVDKGNLNNLSYCNIKAVLNGVFTGDFNASCPPADSLLERLT